MRTFIVSVAVAISLLFLAACDGGGGGGSNSISPPPEPQLVTLSGNINGAVITDANGQEFAITAQGRKLYEVEKRRELANTSVSDDNRAFFVSGVEEGIIVLAQEPVAGVSAVAEASEGDGVAVFGREDSGIVTLLDIETGTDANSEVTAVRETEEIVTLVDPDVDDDGIDNTADNCLIDANADQTDTDGDGEGDVCDDTPNGTQDDDSDGVLNDVDNCPGVFNPDQADTDGDGGGDVCDDTPNGSNDYDSDGVLNDKDNCPGVFNSDQADTDDNGIGDVCEPSSVTVTDPTGDVGDVVVAARVGDFPDYDARADLESYTLSWSSDTVTFSLTAQDFDPAMLEEVSFALDTDADSSGFPEFMVSSSWGDAYSLYSWTGGVLTFVCPVRRSILVYDYWVYVVEFDASCLGDSTELRVRSPVLWSYSVGDPPSGSGNYCGQPGFEFLECSPFVTYIDEMPGSDPLNRTNDDDSDEKLNVLDNCRSVYNPDQADADSDGIGDVCEGTIITAEDTVTVQGRVWAQPNLFSAGPSWNDLRAVCPAPAGECSGVLYGYNMAGWTWASVDDITALFNFYIGSEKLGPGVDRFREVDSVWLPKFFDDGWRSNIPNYLFVAGLTRDSFNVEGWDIAYAPRMAQEWWGEQYMGDVAYVGQELHVNERFPNFGAWFYRTP